MNLLPLTSGSFLLSYCFKTNKTTKRHIYNIFKKKKDKKFCKNLILRPATEVKAWLNAFNTIIADGEGVLWIYNKPVPGAIETMNRLQVLGKQIYVCTNNSTKTRQEHTLKAQRMGLHIEDDAMICSAYATAHYLKSLNFLKYAYVIGNEALIDELDAAGIITHNASGPDEMRGSVEKFASQFHKQLDVGAVVVGYDKHFSFCKLAKAVTYLENPKCLFIATNMDTRSYANNMVIPGTGSFVAAIECCAGREAIGIGKPSGYMCQQYIRNGLIVPRKTLMIGDNCQTDMPFGHNLGFQTLLVGTGIHTWNDVQELKKLDSNEINQFIPDAYIPKLADLSYFLRSRPSKTKKTHKTK